MFQDRMQVEVAVIYRERVRPEDKDKYSIPEGAVLHEEYREPFIEVDISFHVKIPKDKMGEISERLRSKLAGRTYAVIYLDGDALRRRGCSDLNRLFWDCEVLRSRFHMEVRVHGDVDIHMTCEDLAFAEWCLEFWGQYRINDALLKGATDRCQLVNQWLGGL